MQKSAWVDKATFFCSANAVWQRWHLTLQKRIIDFAIVLVEKICKNGTFRIFYATLYILLSVGGSTNRRNKIILGGDYKR